MKRILLCSFSSDDWKVCTKTLEPFFQGEEVEIFTYSIVEPEPVDFGSMDLVLITASEYYYRMKMLVGMDVPVIWIKYTIDAQTYDEIQELIRQEPVSVVADTVSYAEGRQRMLVGLGIPERGLKLWYPGKPESELCRVLLIFEEGRLKKNADHKCIHFYGRGLVSVETLIQMASALDMERLLWTEFFKMYKHYVKFATRQTIDLVELGESIAVAQKKPIFGFLWFAPDGMITYYNYSACKLLKIPAVELVGQNITALFPFLEKWKDRIDEFGERVEKYNGKELVFDIWTNMTHGYRAGYIMISDYKAEKEKELRLRTRMMKGNQHAKYTFNDIRGDSQVMEHCRLTAEKFAKSRATVLITGPSGTGKELFANAIHNASDRRDKPFVAINCGALVESLLESELFGYESGAFTGARKEGKAGLFEIAHEGTLFLDEIGEMPLGLQVKLLRVLQEREVVRVGGHTVIPVDVRIIAATNRNLEEQVEEGKFRIDLFYRLNVLPLVLPGLNERREDILPLFYSIRKQEGYTFLLDAEAEACVSEHEYKGNVRELHNCVEYLGSLEQHRIAFEDMPKYMQFQRERTLTADAAQSQSQFQPPSPATPIPQRLSDAELVLAAIHQLYDEGKDAGRRSIYQKLADQGYSLCEMKIREVLRQLQEEGTIEIRKGRKGIRLNPNQTEK